MAVGDIKAEMVKVIRVTRTVGTGTEKDPVRTEVQYWEPNGKLIVKKDQSEDMRFIGEKVDREGRNGMGKTTEYIQKYGNRYCYEWFMRANIDRVEDHISEVERKAEDMKKRMAVLAATRAAIQIVGMILILKKLSKET